VVYFAIRNEGVAPDGLIRQDGPQFEYLDLDGQWHEEPTLLAKVKEWNVDPVGEAEAEQIEAARTNRVVILRPRFNSRHRR
jgi:hypothetical protein